MAALAASLFSAAVFIAVAAGEGPRRRAPLDARGSPSRLSDRRMRARRAVRGA